MYCISYRSLQFVTVVVFIKRHAQSSALVINLRNVLLNKTSKMKSILHSNYAGQTRLIQKFHEVGASYSTRLYWLYILQHLGWLAIQQ